MKRVLSLLVTLVALSVSAEERLRPFVGELEGTLEQRNPHEKEAKWTAAPVTLGGRWIVSGHYAELRGKFQLGGLERPIELVMLWGWDPFQKEYRLVVLDDLVALIDVYEQQVASPLTLSNFTTGTYFQDAHGRSFNRVILAFLDGDAVRMEWASSRDGKLWVEYARLTFQPSSRSPHPARGHDD